MAERCLNLVMVGSTGSGISSTGNTILGRRVFRTSSSMLSCTKTVSSVQGVFEGQQFLVVDCPGLYSTDKTYDEDFQATLRNKEHALRMCCNSSVSFLLIYMWCERFRKENEEVLKRLTYVFGDEFFNHVIIVITGRDRFYEYSNVTFQQWCMQQRGPLAALFKACEYRIVLVDNKDRDIQANKDQIKSILELSKSLPPYTEAGRFASGNTASSTSAASPTQFAEKEIEDNINTRLHFLLTGKTGHGKSSTGNLLLGSMLFKSKASATAVTSEVTCHYTRYKNFIVKVVDTPGLMDTRLTREEDQRQAVTNMTTAVKMCSEGVDAFLFVHSFDSRFTAEEIATLSSLKNIFGESYMSHLIVILTHGDNFQKAMEFESEQQTFREWCEEQEGEFKELFQKSGRRFVLINNRESDEKKKQEQIDQLYKYVIEIKVRAGRYTCECFKMAAIEREQKSKDNPILKEEIQEALGLLTHEIENLSTGSSQQKLERILACINNAKFASENYTSQDISEIRANLNLLKDKIMRKDLSDLKPLNKEIDNFRKASSAWETYISPIIQFTNGALEFVPGPAGKIAKLVLKGVDVGGGLALKLLNNRVAKN